MADTPAQGGTPAPKVDPKVDPKAAAPKVDPKAKTPDPKAPVVEEPKHKILVKGQEIELPLSEILKRAQKAEGAEKALEEAARLRKEAESRSLSGEQLLASLQKDPKAFIRQMDKLGLNHQEVIKEMLWEAIEEQKLTPEQREQRAKLQKLDTYEKQEAARKQMIERAKLAKEKQTQMVSLAKEVDATIDKEGLPKDRETRARILHYMVKAEREGVRISPAEAAQFVKEARLGELKSVLENLPDDRVKDYLSENFLKKVRSIDLAQFKAKTDPTTGRFVAKDNAAPSPIDKKMTMEEWKQKRKQAINGA